VDYKKDLIKKDSRFLNKKNLYNNKARYSKNKFKNILLVRRSISKLGYCVLNVTLSNIFVTLTNSKGDVLFAKSSGGLKNVKGRKEKCGIYAAEYLGKLLSLFALKKGLRYIFIRLMSTLSNKNLQVLLYTLMRDLRVKVIGFQNYYPYAHNGCRLKKAPRK